MQIDVIQETEDDQIYRMHLSENEFLFKIVGPNSEDWFRSSGGIKSSKILMYFDNGKWIELCRRKKETSKEIMIQLAKSLIPTAVQSKN